MEEQASFPPDASVQEQGQLEAQLLEFVESRSIKTGLESHLEALSRVFKDWLSEHEGVELYDGENGIRAYLQSRRGPKPYDLVSLRRSDPVLFERLVELGCLQVNAAAVKAQGAQVGGIERFAGPEPVSYALQVVKK